MKKIADNMIKKISAKHQTKKTTLFVLLLCLYLNVNAQQRFFNFNGTVPNSFSTTGAMPLITSNQHFKSGTQSLSWTAAKNNQLIANNLAISSSELSDSSSGTAQLWVYSTTATNDTLIFEFLDNTGIIRRTGKMLLNYKGWRDYHRSYVFDYNNGNQLPAFSLNQCRITYKPVANNAITNLYFDDFRFIGDTDKRQPGPHMALDYPHFRVELPQDPLGAYLKKQNNSIVSANTTQLSDLALVKTRYLRAGGNVSASDLSAAKTFVNNCNISRNPNLSIKGRGILATNNPDTLVLLSKHLQSLARAFLRNADNDAKDKLLLFTEYIIDQGIAEGGRNDLATNSYTNARSFPLGFLEALPILTGTLRSNVIDLLKWSHEYNKIYEVNPIPGQNTDFVHIKLTFLFEIACALPSNDESVDDLKYLKNFLERNTDVSEGFRDGIKPDGTGFHHNTHQMSYMYAFATWVDRAFALRGTSFKISQSAYDNMAFAYKCIFLQSSMGGVYANAGSGRTPFQAKVPINATQFRRLVEIGGDITGQSFEPEMAAFYNYTFGGTTYATPNKNYDGFYAYNYANLGIHKRDNWTAAIKGLTSYFFGTEIYATENRYGRYQSYGALEILYNGTLESSGYILNGKGWNWNYMPGTTTVVLPFDKLQAQRQRADEYQVLDFSGALSLGKDGIFGMEFEQRNTVFYTSSNLKFKKSVFAFDSLLVCLGSDISVGNNQGSVVSTLFQTVSTTQTPSMFVNSVNAEVRNPFSSSYTLASANRWLTNSQGTGYYLPKGNNDYRIELGTQTTPDYTSLTGAETNTANFTRAYLVHGNQPTGAAPAKYEYVVAPNVTPTKMRDLATTLAGGTIYTVLNQTADYHAIKYLPNNTTAYVFFKPVANIDQGLLKNISGQALLSLKEYDTDKVLLTINNPDLKPITNTISGFTASNIPINLTLEGNYTVLANPNNASINQQGNLLNLGFSVKDGFSGAILLQKNIVTPINLLNFNGEHQNSSIVLNWLTADEKEVKHFLISRSDDGINFNPIGTVTAKGNSGSKINYTFTDHNYPKGVETIYYKLQSIDTDGTQSAQKIVAIKAPLFKPNVSYYPNPVANVLNVLLDAKTDEELAISVYALNGVKILGNNKWVKKGNNHFTLNLTSLSTAEYVIKITGKTVNSSFKFIKL